MIGAATVLFAPSDTVRRTVYCPGWLYVCEGFGDRRGGSVAKSPRIVEGLALRV